MDLSMEGIWKYESADVSCLVIKMPVTLKASSRDGTTLSLPRMRHSVGNRRTRPDRQNVEIGSET